MPVPSIEDDLEIFQEYGLPLPEEASGRDFEEATQATRQLLYLFGQPTTQGGWTEDGQRLIGKYFYERFMKRCHSTADYDISGEANIRMAHAVYLEYCRHGLKPHEETLIGAPGSRAYAQVMGLWFKNAFPQIVVKPELAASLVSSVVPEEAAVDIVSPWQSFQVLLPDSCLPYYTKDGVEYHVDRVMVSTFLPINEDGSKAERVWNVMLLAGTWEVLAATYPTRDLISDRLDTEDFYPRDVAEDSTSDDDEALNEASVLHTGMTVAEQKSLVQKNARTQQLVRRLVSNICLAISNPDNIKSTSKRHNLGRIVAKEFRGVPPVRSYVLGLPVTIDLRKEVHDYACGERKKAPSVRHLVRGHWRRQPCGPKNQDRKWIQVQAYWKGAEDAPILVRPHVIKS